MSRILGMQAALSKMIPQAASALPKYTSSFSWISLRKFLIGNLWVIHLTIFMGKVQFEY
jgi:hypothetical protein